MEIDDEADVLLASPRDDLLNAPQVGVVDLAARRLDQRPRDAQAHEIEAELADLREVVAAVGRDALIVL